jgi:hypothetical protein
MNHLISVASAMPGQAVSMARKGKSNKYFMVRISFFFGCKNREKIEMAKYFLPCGEKFVSLQFEIF